MRSAPFRSRGRTLIELLISIVLGLLIVGAAIALFVATNQSTRVVVGAASADETGQILLAMVGAAVRRAGGAEIVGKGTNNFRGNLLYGGPQLRGCSGVTADVSANSTAFACTATQSVGDVLAVWYQADAAVAAPQQASFDCLGNTPPSVAVASAYSSFVTQLPLVRNVYYLQGGQLFCQGSGNATPQALFANVEDFRVFFALDRQSYQSGTDMTLQPSAGEWNTATQIEALPQLNGLSGWDFVSAVYVCALVRGDQTGTAAGTAAGGVTQYRRCPQSVTELRDGAPKVDNAADGRTRRAYAQTFTLRGRAAPTPGTP